MKHFFKHKVVGTNPVNNWYQSKGSNPWEKPTTKSSSGFQSGRYLLRETPKRLYQWNTRKKSLSPNVKELLAQTVLENEAYNITKKEEKGKMTAREKKSKCYICKTKGNAFWVCESRKKLAGLEAKHDIEITEKLIAEERMYPEGCSRYWGLHG